MTHRDWIVGHKVGRLFFNISEHLGRSGFDFEIFGRRSISGSSGLQIHKPKFFASHGGVCHWTGMIDLYGWTGMVPSAETRVPKSCF